MYAKMSDGHGPRGGRSFGSVSSVEAETQLNNEVSGTNDAYVLCFFEKPHLNE